MNGNGREAAPPPSDLGFGSGLGYQTQDGNFKILLNASIQVDAAFFDSDVRQLTDDLRARRAQFAVSGSLWHDWTYGAVFDITTGDLAMQDVLVRYSGFRDLRFTAGQFKQPFSLEWLTTSRNITFLERSLMNEFVPGYHLGLMADTHGRYWTASSSFFGNDIDETNTDGQGWGTATRVTLSPWHSKKKVLHFGIAAAYRDLDEESDRLRFRSRPESRLTDVRFVDTRSIRHVDNYTALGFEAAGVMGPFSLQGEYVRDFVVRDGNRSDPEFDGWYVYGSWFLTGESRPYVSQQGRFDRLKPKHPLKFDGTGFGAWEVAARYSAIDLNDIPIRGGTERNWTLALNWYPSRYTRVMMNYTFVDSKRQRTSNAKTVSDDPEIFQLRLQLEF